MNKKFFLIPIIIFIIAIIVIGSQSNLSENKTEAAFHVTLASPDLYDNGVYSHTFVIEQGEYKFRFVPNGDSPKNLAITLTGENFEFSENFTLNGTLHETGISEYYTWDYNGEKLVVVPTLKEIFIQINPNGAENGSVSVDIIRN